MFVRLLPPILSALLLAAHFSRHSQDGLMMLCLVFPLIFVIRRRWIAYIGQIFLIIGSIVWLHTTILLIQTRIAQNQSWYRLSIILGVVSLITALSALVFRNRKLQHYFKMTAGSALAPTFAFTITFLLLGMVHFQTETVLLIIERFLPETAWLEILVLSLYSAWLTEKLINSTHTAPYRLRLWTFFSLVFFIQLLLGISGIEKFLMTGELHLPIPAMIIAGPIFRGQGFFMPILFTSTIMSINFSFSTSQPFQSRNDGVCYGVFCQEFE